MAYHECFLQTNSPPTTSQNAEERELYMMVDNKSEACTDELQPASSTWTHMADVPTVQNNIWRQRLAISGLLALSTTLLAFWIIIANQTSAALVPKVMAKQRMFEQSRAHRRYKPTPDAEMPHLPKFIKGHGSDNLCPYATVALTKEECLKVPEHFGGYPNSPFVITSSDDPHGCFGFGNRFYFNMHPIGNSRTGRKVYCKQFKGFLRFQKLASGQCVDYGFQTIASRDTCEAAALELQLTISEYRVHTDSSSNVPTGCHYLADLKEGTGSLWLNPGPVVTSSQMWQPLCMAQTTTRPPPLVLTTTTPMIDQSLHSHRPRQSFFPGQVGSNSCPHGLVPLNEIDCRQLPGLFGGHLHDPLVIDSPGDPQGCFFFRKWYYFNVHPHGAAIKGRMPYCKSPVRPTSIAAKISTGLDLFEK